MTIKTWPKADRPRDKLLMKGASSLSDTELLALFIQTGIKDKTAIDLARNLLIQFSSIRSLLDAPQSTLCKMPGVGLARYTQFQAILEMNRRYLFEKIRYKKSLNSSKETKQFLLAKFAQYTQEVFACLFLDTKYRIIAYKELFQGSIDRAEVYPRELIKAALAHNASAIIFAHNHPSGDAKPSKSDIKLTKELSTALKFIDIRVLDHLIVGKYHVTSLSERRLIS